MSQHDQAGTDPALHRPSYGHPEPEIEPHPIAFSGDGGVYFGVWIVNVLLTIVTLGLYTPWARRRTICYFYGHTEVAGAPLEFTAGIRSMVTGFLLFAAIYIGMEVAGNTGHDTVVGLIMLGGALLAPWLWGSAMRFRLANTRWRGLRLRFETRWSEIYRASWPIFLMAALWIAAVLALGQWAETAREDALAAEAAQAEVDRGAERRIAELQRGAAPEAGPDEDGPNATAEGEDTEPLPELTWGMGAVLLAALLGSLLCFVRLEFNYKRLLVTRTRIGGQAGRWKPVFGDFVRIWGATVGVFVATALALTVIGAIAFGAFSLLGAGGDAWREGRGAGLFMLIVMTLFIGAFAAFLAGSPALAYREARMFQLMWNNIGAGPVARFRSDLRPRAFVWLRVRNILLGLITLGLYRPFARVAEYRMKAESVTLHVKGDLDQLVGQLEAAEQKGFGDAVADALGLDLIG